MQYNMEVIAHHGVRIHRYRKRFSQIHNAVFNPFPPMLEAPPGESVSSTEKGSANTSRNHMVKPGLLV